MAQHLEQHQQQIQQQIQQQRLSQQQMMLVRMLEMPIMELEDSIRTELEENPALELSTEEESFQDEGITVLEPSRDEQTFEEQHEQEERQDALDAALERIGADDDDLPVYASNGNTQNTEYEEIVYGQSISFYDKLKQQIYEYHLDEQQTEIINYIIGSLDDDGLFRKDISDLVDELAIYHGIEANEEEVVKMLRVLQSFEPAGIGAQSLQECLLLQIDQWEKTPDQQLLRKIITEKFDQLSRGLWQQVEHDLHLSSGQVEALQHEIRRLNPKPGSALSETQSSSAQHITPDFIIETHDNGKVTFTLNNSNIPELQVSPSFIDMIETYKNNKNGMNRQAKEALLYATEKVNKAAGFIEAVKQRRRTLKATMQAIIDLQLKFFQDGDELDLKPMVLKDVAQRTGLDISTISRVCSVKYAQTRWGIFSLKYFFVEGYTTESGEIMTTTKIKNILKELIDDEDASQPLSDSALCALLKQRGCPIARRTVAKYREDMGIAIARERKKTP